MAITVNGVINALPVDMLPIGYTLPTVTTFADFQYRYDVVIPVSIANGSAANSNDAMINVIDYLQEEIETILAADFLASATVTASALIVKNATSTTNAVASLVAVATRIALGAATSSASSSSFFSFSIFSRFSLRASSMAFSTIPIKTFKTVKTTMKIYDRKNGSAKGLTRIASSR